MFSLLQQIRWQMLRNSARLLFVENLLRAATILLACLVIWATLFAASFVAFREMDHRWGLSLDLGIPLLIFDYLFLVLMVMLFFSTSLILFSALFASPESQFLLITPAPDDQIFAYKFQGAIAFSSWGFLLLGSPMLLAYGMLVPGAGWVFFLSLPLFFVGFVLIPGSVGAIVCLLVVNFFPRHWRQLGIVLAGILGVALWWTFRGMAPRTLDREWFDKFLSDLTSLQSELSPPHWVAAGLKAAATGQPLLAGYYLVLVWSQGLFLYLVAAWLGKRLFRRGMDRLITGGTLTRSHYRLGWTDVVLDKLMFFLDAQTRVLILKDLRTFRRDPAQWMQVLIFIVLGGLYFSSMRHYYRKDIDQGFKNWISLLTLTATSFLMCAYTGRFIFPMLSLEGRKFWILGLLPLDRKRLVWGKFAFSAATCFVPYVSFVCFCDWMLRMPGSIIFAHFLTMGVLAIGLSGISVGMGALMPNFRESDPSKIAIGFGGTMNLLLGLFFLGVVIALMALPHHLAYFAGQLSSEAGVPWMLWGLGWIGVAVGLFGTMVPLKLGMRNLARMEF